MLSAQLMIILDMTVVNIALPHIQANLHFSATSLSWVLSGYTLTSGGLLLLGGRAGDILGRRRMFVAGISLFTLSPRWPGGSRPPRACCWPPGPCRAWAGRSPHLPSWRSS
jgi:MFS family permease